MRKSKPTNAAQIRTSAVTDGGRGTLAKAIGRAAARVVTESKRHRATDRIPKRKEVNQDDSGEAAAEAGGLLSGPLR